MIIFKAGWHEAPWQRWGLGSQPEVGGRKNYAAYFFGSLVGIARDCCWLRVKMWVLLPVSSLSGDLLDSPLILSNSSVHRQDSIYYMPRPSLGDRYVSTPQMACNLVERENNYQDSVEET